MLQGSDYVRAVADALIAAGVPIDMDGADLDEEQCNLPIANFDEIVWLRWLEDPEHGWHFTDDRGFRGARRSARRTPSRPKPPASSSSTSDREGVSTLSTEPNVRPGQVWADNDKRCAGRHVIVAHVDSTHATVDRCRPDGSAVPRGGRTRIRLDRFRPTSTGYRLVTDAPGGSR